MNIAQICRLAPVIPVLTITDLDEAIPLAEALVAGGLTVLEITLRSDVALAAIARIRAACPEAVVGAGSLRRPSDLDAVIEAGAVFGVSPGAPAALIDRVTSSGLPFLAGCASATEAMTLADRGFETLKFFPAEQSGGAPLFKALSGPLPDLSFCPTGGVSPDNAPSYLGLPNVVCVGGSWMIARTGAGKIDAAETERKARAAASLRPGPRISSAPSSRTPHGTST
jgi:2-dehydro-3-deoxyphosphogluconate aldolase/(4S)-4-hydroxy-2-oxoglutarate aldolase